MLVLSQLATLFWKQKVNLRADLPSIVAVILLPSALLFLSSTNSGMTASTDSIDLVECKIDNYLYCNYPMNIFPDSAFEEDFYLDVNSTRTDFEAAASKVAEKLGSDFGTLFQNENLSPTSKMAGEIRISNTTFATTTWYQGENNVFAQKFVNLFNEELDNAGSDIEFQQVENPYKYEGNSAFDLRVGSFLLLVQSAGGQITSETSTNLYFYFTRAGLLPSAFWIFQYLYWMIIASASIGVTAIVGAILDKQIEVGPYFIAAWFHIAFAVLLGSMFKSKKVVNMSSFALMIIGFVVPTVFAFVEQSEQNIKIYDVFRCIPVLFFVGNVTDHQMKVGCIISAVLTMLAAYLAPLMAGKSDGIYAGSKVNYLYFLTTGFWKSGIVALPSHNETIVGADEEMLNGDGLVFRNCVKRFEGRNCLRRSGEDKVIGPLTVQLKPGNITTLLGPNGVGKSTLMRVAAGYYIPTEGEMILNGTNTFRENPHSCLQSISFCPQDNYLYDNMTVEEHLVLMSSIRDMSQVEDVKAHIEWILQTLGIFDKGTTLARNLSGGMKRRLCLAISTVGYPPVILCDEPSSGVDSISQRGIWKLLETMKQKSAILLTSHSALEAMILSDSVVMMESSELITQSNGIEGMAFSIKDEVENTTKEYDVDVSNAEELANIISSLPNDGSEWKIASRRLTGDTLPPLQEILRHNEENTQANETEMQPTDEIPETINCEEPGTFRQIKILMSIMFLHPDRFFFIVVFGIPLNVAQIWLVTKYQGWGDQARMIMTPLIPLIPFISSCIIVVQLTEILATERTLGITKLILSQGISRFAYLFSSAFFYFLLSYPVSLAFLTSIGSIYGTPLGIFCIFIIYTSFHYFMMGLCCGLGALLDARTAFIVTIILPSFMAIYGQGAMSAAFHDSYPGAVGQVIAGLLINDVDKVEWTLFGVSIAINIIIGSLSFFIFMAVLGNYNPLRNLCKRKKEVKVSEESADDIENFVREDDNILLEGKAIDKTYGVGENDSASFKALDDVTFAVEKGSLLGLVGKSGAGKSTLMDILCGQTRVSSGAVYVEGRKVIPAEISRVVSMCGQVDTVWPKIKVSTAISIFMLCRGYKGNIHCAKEISDPYISHLIKELGIHEMLNKKVEALSGGQKRRLAFLISLMGNTKVVLVDEAMTGVDIESRQIMWKILQDEVRLRDRSVVVTSHDMSEVEQYCNTVGILHEGKLVEMGPLADIKKKWGDSIKLICLFSSHSSIEEVKSVIKNNQPDIVVESPEIDILNENHGQRIVATIAINLIDLKNIAGLIYTMDNDINDRTMLYWSLEPQSLDDFVRSKSKPKLVNTPKN